MGRGVGSETNRHAVCRLESTLFRGQYDAGAGPRQNLSAINWFGRHGSTGTRGARRSTVFGVGPCYARRKLSILIGSRVRVKAGSAHAIERLPVKLTKTKPIDARPAPIASGDGVLECAQRHASHPNRASAVSKVGALSDLDDIAVRIAHVATDFAVLGYGPGDELGSSTFP